MVLKQKIRDWLLEHPSVNPYKISTEKLFHPLRLLSAPLRVLPDFAIIGAARCGTTSLYYDLIKHPDVYPGASKASEFFDHYYEKGTNYYRAHFPTRIYKNYIVNIKKNNFITGEASTQYYWYPHTAQRIKNSFPNIKLILLLRNPIDRAFSHYNMNVRGAKEDLTFEDAIDEEHQRIDSEYKKILDDPYYFSPKYSLQAYISKSLYINILPNWLKHFKKSQFLIIKSEDFYADPDKIYNQTLSFLNLKPFHLEKYHIVRQGKYDGLNPDTRKKLTEFFKPYNEKLYSYLDRNFEWEL